jgi:hypothetical protein
MALPNILIITVVDAYKKYANLMSFPAVLLESFIYRDRPFYIVFIQTYMCKNVPKFIRVYL